MNKDFAFSSLIRTFARTMNTKTIVTRHIITVILSWMSALQLTAQPVCDVVKYNEADGVSSAHITQLLQDEHGFMWFATWNGLCRYDGSEFQTFKSQVGNGCHMTTDRIRNITLIPKGRILCQDDEDVYIFDLKTYGFRDLNNDERQQVKTYQQKYRQSRSLLKGKSVTWKDSQQIQWTLHDDGYLTYVDTSGKEADYPLPLQFHTLLFAAPDNQGNLWAIDHGNIYRFSTKQQPTQRLTIEPKAEVKCLFADSKNHYFVCTKEDQTIRVYDISDNKLSGYLGADGCLHQAYTTFGAAVYCMYERPDGTLWLGTKPDGLFRLKLIRDNAYEIAHFTDLPHSDVYHITEDRWGRLWVATLGGGIYYTTEPGAVQPRFITPYHYPKEHGRRARYLFQTKDDILMVATDDGLLIAKLGKDAEGMRFLRHQREPNRKESLSCSNTTDIVQDQKGRYFIGTESGGINMIEGRDLLASQLTVRHLRQQFHVQSNDIVQSLTTTPEGGLVAVGSHLITLTDSTIQGRVLDARYFNSNYRFSEAHPLRLPNGRWLFGLTDGAFSTTSEQMARQSFTPRLVLTYLETRGEQQETRIWGIESADTLVLQPEERSLTIHFSALDFSAPEHINYAFRLSKDDEWTYIGHNHSATLLDMEPGTYQLEIRSTNADGEWQDNIRRLTIIVNPTFWESWYGQLLIIMLILGTLAGIAYTILYIRRIRQQHRETLKKYLSLIEASSKNQESKDKEQETIEDTKLDPVIKRVMQFVEENISNSEANVGEMAQDAAISRSGLQRKLKQAMGITPQDLLREARIKHACQLLKETDKSISEIAYACGFTDPKYFSRSFKQSTGKAPSEWKNASE